MQKSAIIRFDLTLPSSSSVSHMPVTPRCIPPRDENARPFCEVMRRRGENEMRCEGKKAGGRVCSGSSGAVGDLCDVEMGWLLVVKSSLSEKSVPCQGSFETGARAGAETVRGILAAFGGVGGGNRDEIEGAEAEEGRRDEEDATGGGVMGGGRQNEPAEDDGVIAQDVASLKGELGSDG